MRTLGLTDLDLLESLLEHHSTSPFFVKDEQLRYLAANRAMARLCGLSSGHELIGRRASDLFTPSMAEHYEALDRLVLATGRSITNVLEPATRPDGSDAWLLFARVPVRDAQGRTVGVAANASRLPSGASLHASYRRLQAATGLIRRKFDQPLRLSEIAVASGTSMAQMERDFLKVFDSTPRAFLHSLRLQEARALLEDNTLSVASIAHGCGYADHSAFARRFRRETGMTPSAYRRGIRSR